MSLMDKAKPYGLGADIDSIFAFLRACFGFSATDARARLQRLRRDLHTPLQEHAATVMKLAQIAYSDLPQANRERYTLDAFIQSVNDLGLHHQFLARGVTTVEDALAEGEAYLLANQMPKSRGNSRQVEVDRANTAAEREAEPSATAAVAKLAAASKVTQLTDMLAKLIATLTHQTPVGNAFEPVQPPALPPAETVSFCWECGNQGHFRGYCPFLTPELNYRSPQMFPPPAGR